MKIVHGSPGFGSQLTEEQTVKVIWLQSNGYPISVVLGIYDVCLLWE